MDATTSMDFNVSDDINVTDATQPSQTTTAHIDAYCIGREAHWPWHGSNIIHLYFNPVVIIVGSLLNVLAVVVLQTRTYRGTSTGFLLTALSLADLGLLLTGILRNWIRQLTDYTVDVRNFSSAACKTHLFATYFFQYVSSWTLTLLTIERAICVINPFKCKQLCSMRRIIAAWVGLVVANFAINAHFFWTFRRDFDIDINRVSCFVKEAFDDFLFGGTHKWLDLVFPFLAPFVIIVVCNTIIIGKLVYSATQRSAMSTVSDQKTSSTTVMLLCVSTVFLLFVSPFQIFALGESYIYWPSEDSWDCAVLDFIYSFTYMLFNANSAVNFLLYCVSGTKFRRAILSLICPKLAARKRQQRKGQTPKKNESISQRTSSTAIGQPSESKITPDDVISHNNEDDQGDDKSGVVVRKEVPEMGTNHI